MKRKELVKAVQRRLLNGQIPPQDISDMALTALTEIQEKALETNRNKDKILDELIFWLIENGFDWDRELTMYVTSRWRAMNPNDHLQVDEFNRLIQAIRIHTFSRTRKPATDTANTNAAVTTSDRSDNPQHNSKPEVAS